MTRKINYRLNPIVNQAIFSDVQQKLWPYYMYEIMAPKIEHTDLFVQLFLKLLIHENKENGRDLDRFEAYEVESVSQFLREKLGEIFNADLINKIINNIKANHLLDNRINSESIRKISSTFTHTVSLSKQIVFQDALTGEIVPLLPGQIDIETASKSSVNIDIKHMMLNSPGILDLRKAQMLSTRLYKKMFAAFEETNDLTEEFDYEEEDFSTYFEDIRPSKLEEKTDNDRSQSLDTSIVLLNKKSLFFEFNAFYNTTVQSIQFTSPFNQETDLWFTRQVYHGGALSPLVRAFLDNLEAIEKKHNDTYLLETKERRITSSIMTKDPLYAALRQSSTLCSLSTYYETNIAQRETSAISLLNTLGVLLEGILLHIIRNFDNIESLLRLASLPYIDFKNQVSHAFSLFGIEYPSDYITKTTYTKWKDVVSGQETIHQVLISRFLAVMLHSVYDSNSKLLSRILMKHSDYLDTFKHINRLRNRGSHYSDVITFNVANEVALFKDFIRTLIHYYDKGVNDGEK